MKLSIITVTLNSAHTIEKTLNSIASQTNKNFEYIVVDGGSTDGTLCILRKYNNIIDKFLSEPDYGLYDAINKGIKLATGDYIGILNSDDVYSSPDILGDIFNILTDNYFDAVYGDVTFFRGDDSKIISRYYSSKIFKPSLLKYGVMPAHTSLFLNSSVFKRFGNYNTDYKIAADFDFMCRIFKDESLKYLYVPCVFVNMKSGGLSTKNIFSKFIIQNELLRACQNNNIPTNHFKLLVRFFYKLFK